MTAPERRLVVTVCPRESGVVNLPVEHGGRTMRLTAATIARELTALVARRGLEARIRVRQGCAGGGGGAGPNVDVRIYAVPREGERADDVAIGWKTYVFSLARLPSLAAVIDENLRAPRARRSAR